MSIVYTFVRYIYSKEAFYISYCLMQIFSLMYIMEYSQLFIVSNLLKESALLLATLSAILFAISFYEGKFIPKVKNHKELLVNTLLLNIVILTSFYHYVLFEYLPYTVVYTMLFISIVFNLKQGINPTMIYVIGWSLLCFILFIFDFKSYYLFQGYIDIVLLAFAIEAILFTISVSYRYWIIQKQIGEYEGIILQQSKLAKTGEMINNITHQFRQPLNNLSYIFINLKNKFENNQLTNEYFTKKYTQATGQIQYLSKTIDDFREFYMPSKGKTSFTLKKSIENVMTILEGELNKKQISIILEFNTNEDIKVFGIQNELSQVILLIVTNSIEAFQNTEIPKISINISSNQTWAIIKIEDNAGGIKKRYHKKIFEPYFSTKEDGSGIGLYLAKNIIEKTFDGKLEFENKKEGVCFTLFIEKSI